MTDSAFNSFEYHPSYGGTEEVELTLDMYMDNNNLYMGMDYYDAELGGMDHFADITVNITDLPYLYSTVDTANNGQKIVDFLVENGIAEPTGLDMPSGYCLYPVMEFKAEALEKISPGVFRTYQKAHGIEPKQQESSVDDLAKEAKERAAEKNAERSESSKANERKPSEMGR